MGRDMLFREVDSLSKDHFSFFDLLFKPVEASKQSLSRVDAYLQSQNWDPILNPRINDDNLRKENSNRFNSRRIRLDGSIRHHKGLDILAQLGSPIYSIMAGKIVSIDNSVANDTDDGRGLGNTIIIESKDINGKPIFIKYCHLNQNSKNLNFKNNTPVRAGEQIGISGNTGNIIKVADRFKHVHIEAATNIGFGNSRVNPEKYLRTKFDKNGKVINENMNEIGDLASNLSNELNIDWGFINQLENNSNTLIAEVPDPKGSKSGVTVAAGFDIGQYNESDLKNMNFSKKLIEKFKPYLGLIKEKALEKLKESPLVINRLEAFEVNIKMFSFSVLQLEKQYNSKSKIPYSDLPLEAQTVIYSVFHQYGSLNRTPTFFKYVAIQDWKSAVNELRNFNDRYPTRRKKEANYLEKLV